MLRNPAYMGDARFNKVHIVPARPRLRPRRGVPEFPAAAHRQGSRRPRGPDPDRRPGDRRAGPVPAVQERLAAHRQHPGRAAVEPRVSAGGLGGVPALRLCLPGSGPGEAGRPDTAITAVRGAKAESDCPGGFASAATRRSGSTAWTRRCGRMSAPLLLEPERLARGIRAAVEPGERPGEGTAQSSRSLDKLIGQVKRRRIARLVEMYADGYIEKESFQRDMDISRKRLTELESERKALQEEESQREELRLVMGRIEEFADQMRPGLEYQRRPRRVVRSSVRWSRRSRSMPRRSILCIG